MINWGKGYRAWYLPTTYHDENMINYVTYGFVHWPSRSEWIVPGTLMED